MNCNFVGIEKLLQKIIFEFCSIISFYQFLVSHDVMKVNTDFKTLMVMGTFDVVGMAIF